MLYVCNINARCHGQNIDYSTKWGDRLHNDLDGSRIENKSFKNELNNCVKSETSVSCLMKGTVVHEQKYNVTITFDCEKNIRLIFNKRVYINI